MTDSTPGQRLLAALREALLGACAVPAGGGLLIGCSGGPDSTALLLALCALQAELELTLRAVYVDHGLRPAAAAEGQQVLQLCQALEVPAQVVAVQVPPGPSLQAAARRVRYQALGAAARAAGLAHVAVGHTASDQAETVLLRLVQGAGLRGLSAMAWQRRLPVAVEEGASPVALVRPLLGCARDQVMAFLAESGVTAVSDPSNHDRRYLRSRLRHEVLPLLRREHPAIERRLGELAESLRTDADYLDEAARAATPMLAREASEASEKGAVVLQASGLWQLPRALAARVLLRSVGALAAPQVAAVLALCQSRAGTATLDLPGGRRAERRYDRLLLWPAAAEAPPPPPTTTLEAVVVNGPGVYDIAGRQVTVTLGEGSEAREQINEALARRDVYVVPAARLPLLLRHPRPGDRLRLPSGGRQRISDLLINAKVPRAERAAVVLLCEFFSDLDHSLGSDEVLWVAGLRAAADIPRLSFDERGLYAIIRW